MDSLARSLILAGLVFVALGLLLYAGPSIPLLGRLPDDIRIERPGLRIYFPITSCLLVSVVLSIEARGRSLAQAVEQLDRRLDAQPLEPTPLAAEERRHLVGHAPGRRLRAVLEQLSSWLVTGLDPTPLDIVHEAHGPQRRGYRRGHLGPVASSRDPAIRAALSRGSVRSAATTPSQPSTNLGLDAQLAGARIPEWRAYDVRDRERPAPDLGPPARVVTGEHRRVRGRRADTTQLVVLGRWWRARLPSRLLRARVPAALRPVDPEWHR
ncbi:MAG: DUF2905 domain-containing protein [Deltaproteobacteria bacterium]|nr:DUF2905 domain-containing protein [Deltaproteobacteria bacterium]